MMTIVIQAIYRDGKLEPKEKLDLPENTPVQLQVIPLVVEDEPTDTLFGAFPELAALTGDEFAWASRLWEHSLEKQSRILDLPQE